MTSFGANGNTRSYVLQGVLLKLKLTSGHQLLSPADCASVGRMDVANSFADTKALGLRHGSGSSECIPNSSSMTQIMLPPVTWNLPFLVITHSLSWQFRYILIFLDIEQNSLTSAIWPFCPRGLFSRVARQWGNPLLRPRQILFSLDKLRADAVGWMCVSSNPYVEMCPPMWWCLVAGSGIRSSHVDSHNGISTLI